MFPTDIHETLAGHPLQQLLQDHLLALSMQQHDSWDWATFVVLYPERNPSFTRGVAEYADLLTDTSTFASITIEDLLAASPPPFKDFASDIAERYLW